MNRTIYILSAVLGIVLTTGEQVAIAQDSSKQECIDAYEQTQVLRKQSKLTAAREKLKICLRRECPDVARNDCAEWLKDVEKAMPTVVFEVHDTTGAETSLVKVHLDGVLFREKLDGISAPIDPGEHVFRYEIPKAAPIEERVIIREGEKNRKLVVMFPKAPLPQPEKPQGVVPPSNPVQPPGQKVIEGNESNPPMLAYVLGGVGIVGVGMFATFGILGLNEYNAADICKPNCNQEVTDSIETKFLIADIAGGVGLLSAGVSAVLFLTAPTTPEQHAKYRFNVQPSLTGAMGTFEADF